MLIRTLLAVMLLVSTVVLGQNDSIKPFKTWSAEVDLGVHSLVSANATATAPMHLGLLVRKNFNRTFGVGLRVGVDPMVTTGKRTGIEQEFTFTTLNLEAIVDVFDVVDLHSGRFTILAHGGPGVSFAKNFTAANLGGGFTGLIKLGQASALKLDYTMTSNINQQFSYGGQSINTSGIGSIVNKFSVGLVMYLGTNEKEHADWYLKECCGGSDVYQSDTTIVNTYNTLITKVVKEEYNPIIQEFVFFNHDSDKITKNLLKRSEPLAAIYRAYSALEWYSERSVKIIGWASATSSSAEYNLELSMRRCKAVKSKLISMGVNPSRILIDAEGKDTHLDDITVHDLARRVELRIE